MESHRISGWSSHLKEVADNFPHVENILIPVGVKLLTVGWFNNTLTTPSIFL